MTPARALLGTCLLLTIGCGSPPPDPQRAGVSLTIASNGSGSTCVPATSMLEIPGGLTSGAVHSSLTCDLSSPTCDPTLSLAEDGKGGVSVNCGVVDAGGGSFSLNLAVDAPGLFQWNATGTVTPSGGQNFHIGVVNHKEPGPSASDTCTVTTRALEPGNVIATYDCPAYDTPGLGQTPGCRAYGAFLFDRCDK